jgi:F0F1-type ATP synthase assembly protein I
VKKEKSLPSGRIESKKCRATKRKAMVKAFIGDPVTAAIIAGCVSGWIIDRFYNYEIGWFWTAQ